MVTTVQRTSQGVQFPAKGFSRQSVESLSGSVGEPGWMLEKRLEAWRQYEASEPPAWKRIDVSKLSWTDLVPYAPQQAPLEDLAVLPPKLQDAVSAYGVRSGLHIQRDSGPAFLDLSPEARDQGVLWTDLQSAVRDYPDLVAPRFMRDAVPVTHDKYTALHAAFWSGGVFLYVPRDVQLSLPLVSVVWHEFPQLAVFPHMLVVAESGSRVTLVSEILSMGCEVCPDTYHGGVTELFLGEGAQVRFVSSQDLGRHVYDLRTQTAVLGRDSRLEWLNVTLGGRVSRSSQRCFLREPGAEALVTGLYLPDGRQQIAFETLQDHVAGNCTSDLLYQGALLGQARAVYEGTIRAWPGAQKTNAYQSNRNLLLSGQARADSLPKLEIEANDLRCTHGATVSQVDENHVFYLMSRGIPRGEAVRLIVEGFFRPSLDRLPESLDGLRERLTGAIAAKLRAG